MASACASKVVAYPNQVVEKRTLYLHLAVGFALVRQKSVADVGT